MERKNMKQLVAVVKRGEASYWTRIGVAFENRKDGSWNLLFDFLPSDPRTTIQLRDVRVRAEQAVTVEDVEDAKRGIAATPF